jgi:hypothetical protein
MELTFSACETKVQIHPLILNLQISILWMHERLDVARINREVHCPGGCYEVHKQYHIIQNTILLLNFQD